MRGVVSFLSKRKLRAVKNCEKETFLEDVVIASVKLKKTTWAKLSKVDITHL